MKKLLLVLLFVPLVCFGQTTNVTNEEIKQHEREIGRTLSEKERLEFGLSKIRVQKMVKIREREAAQTERFYASQNKSGAQNISSGKDNLSNIIYFLTGIGIIVIVVVVYNQQKNKTPALDDFQASIENFGKNMFSVKDWHQVIQSRGNGHAMFAKSMGIKVDDYEYWANAHKEEYMMKYNEGNLDIEGVKLRIKKFGYIVSEFEKVIKKVAELKLNITTEMHNDYCAARASVLGAEYALKEMTDEQGQKVKESVIEVKEKKQNKDKFCPSCGAPILGENQFCTGCGNKLI